MLVIMPKLVRVEFTDDESSRNESKSIYERKVKMSAQISYYNYYMVVHNQ